MTGPPSVSVVVPAFNAAATIADQLSALLAQDGAGDYEVVVVDNGSTDATRKVVESFAARDPRVRLERANDGRGPSYARNVGVTASAADFIVCCDADDVVAPDWIAALRGADADYVGGPLRVERLNPSWLVEGRGRWGSDRPGRWSTLDFAHGCNIGFRRAVFNAAGGFDEGLHAGEEVDLALRLAAQGVVLRFVPEAVVHYRYRAGLCANWAQSYAHGAVARVLERRAHLSAIDPPKHDAARRALWLALRSYKLATRAGRIRWTWVAANECGRLRSAVRARQETRRAR